MDFFLSFFFLFDLCLFFANAEKTNYISQILVLEKKLRRGFLRVGNTKIRINIYLKQFMSEIIN